MNAPQCGQTEILDIDVKHSDDRTLFQFSLRFRVDPQSHYYQCFLSFLSSLLNLVQSFQELVLGVLNTPTPIY